LVIVVTSEGLVRVDDRKNRGTGGDGESDSNKYEDFFHGRILSKGGSLNYITATLAATTSGHHHRTINSTDLITASAKTPATWRCSPQSRRAGLTDWQT
jgi:hypothetical protein